MPETQVTETTETTTTQTVAEVPVQEPERESNLLTDILTIIGFAILFIIILWGFVHLVQLVASSLSGNFGKPAPTVQVTAPAHATSGQPMSVSWNYTPTVAGNYAFLYQCENGLTMKLQSAEASSSQVAIPCGTAYTTANANNSLTLVPTLSTASSTSDTISIVFIPSKGGSQVQGNATTIVDPVAKPAPATKTATKTYVSPYSYSTTNYSGPAQLSVRIISGTVNPNGTGTVTFDIANIGGATSGTYSFSAQLPTAQPYPYQSPIQAPLAPGSHVTSTLNFTDVQSGGGTFSVTIEGANATNGYATIQLTAPYNNYNNGYNQTPYVQYPTYTY
jgi:hypothetical protein